jgi:anoctamin-1
MIFRDDKKTPTCMRSALHYNWARFQNIFLFSPTDAIQTYFGEEVGLYFAFITVYTIALAVFSVVGIWCIVYGVLTLPVEKETGYVKELCDLELVMCPKCNSGCPFYSGKSGAKELI